MKTITLETLQVWMHTIPGLLIWDVREPHEIEEKISGIENIPLYEIPNRLDELKAYTDREIVLVCDNGERSHTAALFLEQNGFKRVSNLENE
jgi:rhodanese-related sulfurtransferase